MGISASKKARKVELEGVACMCVAGFLFFLVYV